MKNRIETFTTLLLFFAILLAGCTGCAQKTAQQEVELANKKGAGDGHLHDGVLHPDHHHVNEHPKIPEPPADDAFFETIQFPKTPPTLVHGHYVPAKNPFPVPDYVKNNPDLFVVDEKGFWRIDETSKKMQEIDQFQYGDGPNDPPMEIQIQRHMALIREGLDPLTAGMYFTLLGGYQEEASAQFEQAYKENPDGFYELLYWSTGQVIKNPDETEAGYRRLVALYPNSKQALYTLARFILDYTNEPDEAIPYFEKVYHMDPSWYAPLLGLGEVYFKLGQFEKALTYLQASEVFTGGPSDTSALFISAINRHLNKGE